MKFSMNVDELIEALTMMRDANREEVLDFEGWLFVHGGDVVMKVPELAVEVEYSRGGVNGVFFSQF